MNNKRILICDDDEGILDMLEFILADCGFDIVPVKNSLLIYDSVREQHPDLLLLDLWMPVLSGDQVVRALRKSPDTKDLPIIVISASREGKQIAIDAGADDFIAKPFDIDMVLDKINRLTSV